MDFHEALEFAQERTEVLRTRKNPLYTFGATRLPYICLSGSPRHDDEIVIREGEVTAERPQIAIPGQDIDLEGFEFESEEERMAHVFLARRIEMPVGKYTNKSTQAQTEKGHIDSVAERRIKGLDDSNDIRTAVLTAPNRVWNLAVLLYVGSQVMRSAPSNIAEHIERMRLHGRF